jgi:2-dehydro-3-deoxyphosphooctonate aldolase (KDO 8-P synthase)
MTDRITGVRIGNLSVGAPQHPLAFIGGPCVVESLDLCREVAREALRITQAYGMGYIFKASFDKANRTSAASFRGQGMEHGLEVLAAIKSEFGVPVLTDVHETWRAVNIKKGQFLAPWDMKNVVQKVVATGNTRLLVTERGISFGYNTLVVDMTSLPQLRALGFPVVFDGTHSVQLPGGAVGGTASSGQRQFIPHLTRAAVAVGIDVLFLEIHPDPARGLSDTATMLPLADLDRLLGQVNAIERALYRV